MYPIDSIMVESFSVHMLYLNINVNHISGREKRYVGWLSKRTDKLTWVNGGITWRSKVFSPNA